MTDVEKLDGFRKIAGWHAIVLGVMALVFWVASLPTDAYDVGVSSAPMLAGLCLIGAVMAFVTMVGLWSMTQTEEDDDAVVQVDEYATA